jgi:hypothetical protein
MRIALKSDPQGDPGANYLGCDVSGHSGCLRDAGSMYDSNGCNNLLINLWRVCS